MRLVITGISYAPEETGIAPYTTGLAEHLAAKGHEVTVLTGVPSYPQWRVYPEYRRLILGRERRRGVDIRRVRNYVPKQHSKVQRSMYELSFLLHSLTMLTMPKPGLVLGVVPSLSGGLLARLAARRHGCPYALIFQDLTGPAVSQSGVGTGRAADLTTAVEASIARGAAALGVIAEGFRHHLESIGVQPDRIHRVRNWLHTDEPMLDRNTVRRRLELPINAVLCLHAGNIGYKQGLENVIECARLAINIEDHLFFVIVGDGNRRQEIVQLAEQHKLRNVRFLPIQPTELFSSLLAAADMLLVNQRASVTNMSLPGKLTSYFASGRPVVAAVSPESETARELLNAESGVLVPPEQPELLLEAIRKLAADPDLQAQLGGAGRRYALTALRADYALAVLENFIHTAANSSARSFRNSM